MKVSIIGLTQDGGKICGIAADTCTGNKSENVYKPLINAMKMGHMGVTEHASYTFLIEGISSVTLAQLSRHRFFSFCVKSERYCGASDRYVIPPFDYLELHEANKARAVYTKTIETISSTKRQLRKIGVHEEDIRFISPKSATYDLVATANARELLHFFALRCCTRSQWEIRELANKMMDEVKKEEPLLFAHGGAYCVQYGYCPEGAKSCGKAPTIGSLLNTYKNNYSVQDGEE